MPTIQLFSLQSSIQEKKCTRCNEVKPVTAFSPRGDYPNRLRSHCNACKNTSKREYVARNYERVRATDAMYRESRKSELKIRQRQWREANPGRDREIHSQWKRKNKDTVNASTHRRRARIRGNGGSFTSAEWKAIKAAQNHQCLMCHRHEPEIKLTVDHVIPVSQGGLNIASNIQGLCKSCNSKKHRKVLDLRKG